MNAFDALSIESGLDAEVPHRLPVGSVSVDWVEGGAAALDSQGRVMAVNEALEGWLGAGGTEGKDFWLLLGERCCTWRETLNSLRSGTEVFAGMELSLPGTAEEGGAIYRLEVTRLPGGMAVGIQSVLPSRSALAEEGWGGGWSGVGPARAMFGRLLRAEAQLEKLTRYWPGVIFSQRPDLSFQFVSGRIEALTGLAPSVWERSPGRFWEVVHEADAEMVSAQLSGAARTGGVVSCSYRIRNLATGRVSYVLEHRQPLLSRSGLLLGYEGAWLDITRQALAERLLTSAAWKETLAVLTMGLAHDFSNVMAGIHSLSESYLSQMEVDHPFREGLGLIRKSSLQASQLVHRIVHLHLGKPGERTLQDLNQVVGELLELVRKVIPRRIEVSSALSAVPLPVQVDAFEFRQVILNLALNASDAMPERGRLELRTERRECLPEGARWQGAVPRPPCVCMAVQDTGSGIKEEHRDLVFDPFFTTKASSKGSGLGLYNARLFAEKHGGALRLVSKEGEGSIFEVWLPEADLSGDEMDREAQETVPAPRRSVLLHGPQGSIIDDLVAWLRTEGIPAGVAASLEEVGEVLRTREYPYDGVWLVTDSGGAVLAAHAAAWRRMRPELRMIVQPAGLSPDHLDAGLLRQAHLVVLAGWSPAEVLIRIRALWSDGKR